ncbi:cytochrome d ubiquinol oxidase subunit II [Halocatena pleomorpha]|uniref:Cytochrome d ubiquinol oxidase subunit II n=1 Tax=Halocatena pleomorpha TaxID=1785090 RepID=A0A3P3RLH3_9EURY|nr:cytochrome d ubiquinol oxidase subunit II [Halocatena pleomorpha]RRJ34215.1 cytochrome d ubiquinol oxidase subunit II [Halocatena pleomorpha]
MINVEQLGTEPLFGLPLADLWFILLFVILGMFLFLDGFDFGIGILFAIHNDDAEKSRLLAAITPFWDANEVWLVVFGGSLFAAFPAVYANLFSRHYPLMFAILAALGLRGLSPEMYEQREDERWQLWWGRAFVLGSLTTPFLLGIFLANWLLGRTAIITLPGIVVGLAVVALTVVDGVAFLRLKLRGELRDQLRTDGHRALAAYLLTIMLILGYVYFTDPARRSALRSPIVGSLVVLTFVFAGMYAGGMSQNRNHLAFGAAAGLVFSLVGVVAGLLFPTIDPRLGLTVESAAVSILPLNIMSIGAALLLPLIYTYFGVLYSAFSGPIKSNNNQ